jgi:hypothetical protein
MICPFEFLTPFTLGANNFFIFYPFLTIVIGLDAPRGGDQVLLGHQKKTEPSPWIQPLLNA